MKAIVTRRNPDGTYDQVGMNNRFITREYKTLRGLMKYGIPHRYWDTGFIVTDYETDRVIHEHLGVRQ